MISSRLVLGAVLALAGCATQSAELALSPAAATRIGQRLWQNECGGSVAGLTSWNAGEDFPSLGIGHFIWYPDGRTGPFQESFPSMIRFLRSRGAEPPAWVVSTPHCPWPSRAAFQAELNGPRLSSLRAFLKNTVGLQTEFAAARAKAALGTLLAAAPGSERGSLAAKYDAVGASPQGVYALVDYVNFKGEGTNPSERYQGQGWGLLQVLQEMRPVGPGPGAAAEFSAAAKRVLDRRISLAPRPEGQWRAGWFSRCDSYGRAFR